MGLRGSPNMVFGPLELGIVLAIVVLLFGASKLPRVARAIGRAPGELERGHRESRPDD